MCVIIFHLPIELCTQSTPLLQVFIFLASSRDKIKPVASSGLHVMTWHAANLPRLLANKHTCETNPHRLTCVFQHGGGGYTLCCLRWRRYIQNLKQLTSIHPRLTTEMKTAVGHHLFISLPSFFCCVCFFMAVSQRLRSQTRGWSETRPESLKTKSSPQATVHKCLTEMWSHFILKKKQKQKNTQDVFHFNCKN